MAPQPCRNSGGFDISKSTSDDDEISCVSNPTKSVQGRLHNKLIPAANFVEVQATSHSPFAVAE
jgi:hypothetical protein